MTPLLAWSHCGSGAVNWRAVPNKESLIQVPFFLICSLFSFISGALLLRVVNVIYSMHLKWDVVIKEGELVDDLSQYRMVLPQEESTKQRGVETNAFVTQLCDILHCRLNELSAVFDAICAPANQRSSTDETTPPSMPAMLSHGMVLALKYCLEDVNSNGHLLAINSREQHSGRSKQHKEKPSHSSVIITPAVEIDWSLTIRRIMKLALKSLQTALQIVAETPVDNYFAPVPKAESGKDHLLQDSAEKEPGKKSSNTHGYASDSFMLNTNIFMDLEEPNDDLNDTKEDSIGRRMQYAVVGAWLLVKESCSLLAKLVEISPPPPSLEEEEGSNPASNAIALLTTEEIATIGSAVLDSLARLKHNGAIAEAQAALQSICESVLKFSGRSNVSLSRLPIIWLHSLIDKLNGEQQVPLPPPSLPLPQHSSPSLSGVYSPKICWVCFQLPLSLAI
jgi:hypothetical protein